MTPLSGVERPERLGPVSRSAPLSGVRRRHPSDPDGQTPLFTCPTCLVDLIEPYCVVCGRPLSRKDFK